MKYGRRPLLTILLISCITMNAQTPVFEKAAFEYEGKTLNYRILMPVDFDASKQYPLHLFLHGAGERGDDNEAQLIHGSNLFLEENKKHPAIVIFPQCPKDDYWAQTKVTRDNVGNSFSFPKTSKPGWAMSAVMALLDQTLKETYIDKSRIYLGGLSMGGMGTFELLSRRPDTFAAATPICGGGNIENVIIWANKTPLWIFHGDADKVVPSLYSKSIMEALIREGVEPRFSLYPAVGHDSWTSAFAEPNLFDWIYGHSKKPKDAPVADLNPFSEANLLGKYKAESAAYAETDNNNFIVFIGDSITQGWETTSPEFWEQHPQFINRGYSGHTTSQMLLRFRQEVINIGPKQVIILAGTNDIAGNTGITSIETIANNIFTMADLAKQHNIKVVIASVLPVYDYPWIPGLEPASKIIELNEMLMAYAQANQVDYLDYHTPMKNVRNGLKEAYTYDMVHCTQAGYLKMEEILLGFFRLN